MCKYLQIYFKVCCKIQKHNCVCNGQTESGHVMSKMCLAPFVYTASFCGGCCRQEGRHRHRDATGNMKFVTSDGQFFPLAVMKQTKLHAMDFKPNGAFLCRFRFLL